MHRECLNRWRGETLHALHTCSTCQFNYILDVDSDLSARRMWPCNQRCGRVCTFILVCALDVVALLCALQVLVFLLGYFIFGMMLLTNRGWIDGLTKQYGWPVAAAFCWVIAVAILLQLYALKVLVDVVIHTRGTGPMSFRRTVGRAFMFLLMFSAGVALGLLVAVADVSRFFDKRFKEHYDEIIVPIDNLENRIVRDLDTDSAFADEGLTNAV